MGSVAIISGASSGIGAALAKKLAQRGYAVGLLARRLDSLESLKTEIEAEGGVAAAVRCDVAAQDQVAAAVDACRTVLGPIDLAIANAGVRSFEPQLDSAEIERVFRVNVLGASYLFESVLPEMLDREHGHLVAVASLAGLRGGFEMHAYGVSKAALIHLAEGLRNQLRHKGIAVTTVTPGYVKTAMTDPNDYPMPFLMDVDAAAAKIIRGIDRRSSLSAFPRPFSTIARVAGVLPNWLFDFVAGSLGWGRSPEVSQVEQKSAPRASLDEGEGRKQEAV